MAEATGGLPHQVHGPAIGGQGEEHVVADFFVAEHLVLEDRIEREGGNLCPSCPLPQPPPAPEVGACRPAPVRDCFWAPGWRRGSPFRH